MGNCRFSNPFIPSSLRTSIHIIGDLVRIHRSVRCAFLAAVPPLPCTLRDARDQLGRRPGRNFGGQSEKVREISGGNWGQRGQERVDAGGAGGGNRCGGCWCSRGCFDHAGLGSANSSLSGALNREIFRHTVLSANSQTTVASPISIIAQSLFCRTNFVHPRY